MTVLLEAGANINTVAGGFTPLNKAAISGNHRIIRAISTAPGIMLDEQVRVGWTLFYH